MRTVDSAPVPHFVVTKETRAWGSERLEGSVQFDYEGSRVRAWDARSCIVDRNRRTVVQRRTELETEKESDLAALGLKQSDSWANSGGVAYQVAQTKLPTVVRTLMSSGWIVEAEGKLFRSAKNWNVKVTSGIDWFGLDGAADFDGATADLLNVLRIEPAQLGELREIRKGIFAKTPSPEAATAALRQDVYSARRLLNDERAQLAPAIGAAATPQGAAAVATAPVASPGPILEAVIANGAASSDSGLPESPAVRVGDDMLDRLNEVKGQSDIAADVVKSAATRAAKDDAAKLGALVDTLSVQAELFIDTPMPDDLAALTTAVEVETAEQ